MKLLQVHDTHEQAENHKAFILLLGGEVGEIKEIIGPERVWGVWGTYPSHLTTTKEHA